ncbi:MAG: hypothetical protein ABWW65_04975 [Thermoprotei archaeon]
MSENKEEKERSSEEGEEREIYELIASLPVDLGRTSVLYDITFEAQLLIKSRFVKNIVLKYDDFKKISDLIRGKNLLLTTEINNKRFVIYVENGKIISSLLSDSDKGVRIAGLKPLATLIALSRNTPIKFRLFEIAPAREETPQPPEEAVAHPSEIGAEESVAKPARAEEKPPAAVFAEKLAIFKEKATKIIHDSAPAYGCSVIDLEFGVKNSEIYVKIVVRKKGLFSKCRVDKLEEILKNDLQLVATMHDLNLPIKLDIILQPLT